MISPRFFVLAAAVSAALALPTGNVTLSRRDYREPDNPGCISSIPEGYDPSVIDTIYIIGAELGISETVMLATYETCYQETRCWNLGCGDADSLGVFQQRPAYGWGTPEQITNVDYSTRKFLEVAIPLAAANPGFTPNQVAQGVQNAEYGDHYGKHLELAKSFIQEAAARTGVKWNGLGGGSPAPPPPSGGGQSSGGGGGGCSAKVTAQPGDSCWAIATARGMEVGAFIAANPGLDSGCSNLQAGQEYCVSGGGGGSAPAPPPPSGGGGSGGCEKITVQPGDSCWSIANYRGIDVGAFISKNPGLDAGCSNLQAGQEYCI